MPQSSHVPLNFAKIVFTWLLHDGFTERCKRALGVKVNQFLFFIPTPPSLMSRLQDSLLLYANGCRFVQSLQLSTFERIHFVIMWHKVSCSFMDIMTSLLWLTKKHEILTRCMNYKLIKEKRTCFGFFHSKILIFSSSQSASLITFINNAKGRFDKGLLKTVLLVQFESPMVWKNIERNYLKAASWRQLHKMAGKSEDKKGRGEVEASTAEIYNKLRVNSLEKINEGCDQIYC